MNYKIVVSNSPRELSEKINKMIDEGWRHKGSHQVRVIYSQNKFSGSQHMSTQHTVEYSQTMVR